MTFGYSRKTHVQDAILVTRKYKKSVLFKIDVNDRYTSTIFTQVWQADQLNILIIYCI